MKFPIITAAVFGLSACVANTPCDWTANQLRDCVDKVQRGELRIEDCTCTMPNNGVVLKTDRRGEMKTPPERSEPETSDREPDSRTDPEGYQRWKDARG